MLAVNCYPTIDCRGSGDSAYTAPRSNPITRWGTAITPSPFALPSRPVLLQFAQTVAQVLAKQVNTDLLEDLHSKDREIQALKAGVNRLEGIVQQLLQQQESRIATIAQPRTSPAQNLAPIAAIYGALDAEQTAFLQERSELLPVLLQAKPIIREVFAAEAKTSLELLEVDSPSAHLCILIHTALSYPESIPIEKALRAKWKAAIDRKFYRELTFILYFE